MNRSHVIQTVLTFGVGVVLLGGQGCGGGGTSLTEAGSSAEGGAWQWVLPTFFPTPQVPDTNVMNIGKVTLGRFLFYDKRLSGNGTLACAGCHQPEKAFTDGRVTAIGSTGELHPRNAQGLANVVYLPSMTWANPALTSLERQMEVPMFGSSPVEMGINDRNQAEVLERIRSDARYLSLFAQAFPEASTVTIDFPHIIQAIAAFERTLLSGNARYDLWLQGKIFLSASETRGKDLFFGEKAECFHCHGSFNFNDQVKHANGVSELSFHNTGLYNLNGQGAYPEPNQGVFELTGKAQDMGAFRAPSLRNVALTAPYMHDGSVNTLEEVLDIYAAGGRNISAGPYAGDGRRNPYKSDLISRIDLSTQDKADIIAFLKTLTDEDFVRNPAYADPFQNP